MHVESWVISMALRSVSEGGDGDSSTVSGGESAQGEVASVKGVGEGSRRRRWAQSESGLEARNALELEHALDIDSEPAHDHQRLGARRVLLTCQLRMSL